MSTRTQADIIISPAILIIILGLVLRTYRRALGSRPNPTPRARIMRLVDMLPITFG
jgi:hypothetical protein